MSEDSAALPEPSRKNFLGNYAKALAWLGISGFFMQRYFPFRFVKIFGGVAIGALLVDFVSTITDLDKLNRRIGGDPFGIKEYISDPSEEILP